MCDHRTLSCASSAHSSLAGYSRPTPQQREAAATLSKGKGKSKRPAPSEDAPQFGPFCAPLVLPDDELACDPEYPPQSIQEWYSDEDRNPVLPERNTIYVAAPPSIASSLSFATSWCTPKHADASVEPPDTADIVDYLAAFYHGMPVKRLPPPLLRLTHWGAKPSATPRYVGLTTATECVRLRTRASRDGEFVRQLNLDDLLDAAISLLPKDAFSLLLLVPFDIYESPDDDFACGRAYGGSRVAVISTARYHPGLDRHQSIDRLHAWPASHCQQYMDACCSEAAASDAPRPKKKLKATKVTPTKRESASLEPTAYAALSPLHAAVVAHNALPSLDAAPTSAALAALWLGRACRTASHELGHCLGIDHCVYYACAMQGTASLREDGRQPPFLCPIDLAKLLHATGSSQESAYCALLAFCDKHPHCHLFAAFAAWIRAQCATAFSPDEVDE
ncbi:hypothetical protein B0H15DRAFT_921083 [Mycena belliarum]|uniref:Archaemetzincin-2 n=1 Tax=Mycena belliarum TaxID=1033014 RepID=A0AAD6XXT3_9AGAR|nr:hypothetical protein B0H15DRAFT_921083 [Mycena belliae]